MYITNIISRISDNIGEIDEIVYETIGRLASTDDPCEAKRRKLELARLREGVDAIYSKAALICIDLLREERRLQDKCYRKYEDALLSPENYDRHHDYLSSHELGETQNTREDLEILIDWVARIMGDIDKAIERR